jgi:glycosyltransferase involved in cell wall biosynthesis
MNKGPPLVSIIMTVYNTEERVKRAVNSILGQTYKNIELIIINDQSSDNTLSSLIELKKTDKRIKVINNLVNAGTYCCKNYGMMIARGEYITFHDADDWCEPNHIETLYNIYHEDIDRIMSFAGFRQYWKGKPEDLTTYEITRGTFKGLVGIAKASVTSFFKKDLVDKIGYFDSVRFGADTEFANRAGLTFGRNRLSPPVVSVDRVTYHYDRLATSLCHAKNTNLKSDARTGYWEVFRKWHEHLYKTRDKKAAYMKFPMKKEERPFQVNDPNNLILSLNVDLNNFKEVNEFSILPPVIDYNQKTIVEAGPDEPPTKWL